MRKKIIGMLVVGLVVALMIPIGSAYATYDCELTAVGVIRIDKVNNVIKGFVFFGNNDGEVLRFTFIKIHFDQTRTPSQMPTEMPFFVHHIDYNPAK